MEKYKVSFMIKSDEERTRKEVYAKDYADAEQKTRDKYPMGKGFMVISAEIEEQCDCEAPKSPESSTCEDSCTGG